MHEITFTLDLEDHQPDHFKESHYSSITKNLLASLRKKNISATVFVLGDLAYSDPELIMRIANDGHEIAYHSYRHTPLTAEEPDKFLKETEKFKKYIYDLCDVDVKGFRAPVFSLTSNTMWVLDALKQLDFVYSSSILPAGNPLFGYPTAPRHPYRWNNGILEFPAPIQDIGPVSIPFLGGIYFRYLPLFLIKKFIKSMGDNIDPWIYCHPHDFDYKQPYFKIPDTSHIVSLLLWFNRRNTNSKLFKIINHGDIKLEHRSFIEQIEAGKYDTAPFCSEV
jgi:peptidoglycan-N-acetylglucosamine deacetylase